MNSATKLVSDINLSIGDTFSFSIKTEEPRMSYNEGEKKTTISRIPSIPLKIAIMPAT